MTGEPEKIEAFIGRWRRSGGAERANYQMFLTELTEILGVERPAPAEESNRQNDYVFERSVAFKHPDGSQTTGFIDLYKRDSFVLEAKQSGKRTAKPDASQLALMPEDAGQVKAGTATRGTRRWDTALLAARRQAEDYAKALPKEHGWPPFLVVVDVGHCIELYADFVRQGKNYAQFPDRRGYRIMLEDLRDEAVRERLRLVWTDPMSLDPARKSAVVTRDIAERLAKVARTVEKRGHAPGKVAEFLMRCLFTMFAEDVELLPSGAFTKLLDGMKDTPDKFKFALEDLWKAMNKGGFAGVIQEVVKRFNGGLFAHPEAIALEPDEIHELWVAARQDWRDVEPAIFGTLLERALDTRERHKLGAHYTPRAYVERLVVPTIIEPLTADWKIAQAEAEQLMREGKPEEARKAVKAFHEALCHIRVLDPACGTVNFLYVSMELMKRLEGEVLEYLADLGEEQYLLELSGHTVDPHQFLGLEINPRAVQIADLVIWIGFLKWQIRTGGQSAIEEPVLRAFRNIKEQDAVLAYDKRELVRDEHGKPVTRWDGVTMKKHPVTGEDVPDDAARIELYTYSNPKPAEWPKADFIVGNPPFIGDKRMRDALGDGYVDAIRKAYKALPGSIDFVLYWWNMSAQLVRSGAVRRFGLITTNTLGQSFNRKVVADHLSSKNPLNIVFAVPDHPWVDPSQGASVRISMTVGATDQTTGQLLTVTNETPTDNGEISIQFNQKGGAIDASLYVGPAVSMATALLCNKGIACNGMMLSGRGFVLSEAEATRLKNSPNGEKLVRPYLNGTELLYGSEKRSVVDAIGWSASKLQSEAPALFQHLLEHVKPVRDQNNRKRLKEIWFEFAEPRRTFRPALSHLKRYIGTTETAKHRVFQFIDASVVPDHMIVAIAEEEAAFLGVLSSKLHTHWALKAGGRLGVGNDPRYQKSVCFDPFPFPDLTEKQKAHLRELGERLDAFRKERQAEHPDLTMTGMYNVLERLRELEANPEAAPLNDKERAIHEKGLVSVLKQIHDEIDAATFDAYGWPRDLTDEEILERLVALNKERAEEEKRGIVRWLRPDYQIPRFGKGLAKEEQVEATLDAPAIAARAPQWPAALPDQIRAVRAVLAQAERPVAPQDLARAFKGGKKRGERVTELLESLSMLGQVREDGGKYFLVDRG
ncbi:MAG: type IIL restriction-modification enzyme MmeI [Parvibaculum sp.]|uniref:class I SAM-dependent DNA methyltransferase n=1 Tax=Parvibaculum sp. TaxID=2024848 RepID=UPI002ABAEE13|nr:DNA methyltransferase [Parvibaculum sp.]MDZ4380729.1 type IIL restriction-modification enzyme MmeI [Parvibaculum sp.]